MKMEGSEKKQQKTKEKTTTENRLTITGNRQNALKCNKYELYTFKSIKFYTRLEMCQTRKNAIPTIFRSLLIIP